MAAAEKSRTSDSLPVLSPFKILQETLDHKCFERGTVTQQLLSVVKETSRDERTSSSSRKKAFFSPLLRFLGYKVNGYSIHIVELILLSINSDKIRKHDVKRRSSGTSGMLSTAAGISYFCRIE